MKLSRFANVLKWAKIIGSIVLTMILFSCSSSTKTPIARGISFEEKDPAIRYAKSITAKELSKHLFDFASDKYEGRLTGEPGQKRAANYLKQFYVDHKIPSPLADSSYFQKIPSRFFNGFYRARGLQDSENVLAFIEGSEKPHEVLVISAHLDHIGKTEQGEIYNGADDDGSGNVAILEIAEAFKMAAEDGNGPKRSILFLHVTAEEKGLLGSLYYTMNPAFPLIF